MSSKMLGHLLLEDAIPAAYRPEGAYNNKNLLANMIRLAKDDPEQYVKTITHIKKMGDEFATLEGISVGLDDISPIYHERDAILKPALAQIKKTQDVTKRRQILADTQEKFLNYTKDHPGTMGTMARSGGRGNTVQLMKVVASPTASSDENDEIQPWLIAHSYSEGLRPSEFWTAAREARMSAVKSNLEVTEPGDLSKILINNSSHQVITVPDCNTHNGLVFNTDDASILDRYTARQEGAIAAGTLITPRVQSELRKLNTTVLVRSPMTCEAREGLCQKCVGLNSMGSLNKIGSNMGIRASQALGEPLTQLALNAKHGVRIAGADPMDVGGLTGFRAILESPESFKNKATLTPIDGTVKKIEAAAQGGHYVTVDTQRLHVAQGLTVTVHVGDHVNKGDTLSTGVPRPDEVVALKGLGAGREYVVQKLAKIYKDSGVNVDRRHLETLAKSTLNYVQVDDINDKDSAEHGLVRGDIINYNQLINVIGTKVQDVPVSAAKDKYLGETILYHTAGTKITEPMIEEFTRAGITHVRVGMNAPKVIPIMAAASRNPLLNPDVFVRMGHRYLKKSMVTAAQEGQTSELHSTNPVSGMVLATEFGEGDNGKY